MVDEAEELTDSLRTQVLFAREYLKSVTIGPKQVTHMPQGIPVMPSRSCSQAHLHGEDGVAAVGQFAC